MDYYQIFKQVLLSGYLENAEEAGRLAYRVSKDVSSICTREEADVVNSEILTAINKHPSSRLETFVPRELLQAKGVKWAYKQVFEYCPMKSWDRFSFDATDLDNPAVGDLNKTNCYLLIAVSSVKLDEDCEFVKYEHSYLKRIPFNNRFWAYTSDKNKKHSLSGRFSFNNDYWEEDVPTLQKVTNNFALLDGLETTNVFGKVLVVCKNSNEIIPLVSCNGKKCVSDYDFKIKWKHSGFPILGDPILDVELKIKKLYRYTKDYDEYYQRRDFLSFFGVEDDDSSGSSEPEEKDEFTIDLRMKWSKGHDLFRILGSEQLRRV